MLIRLALQNIAIISELELTFQGGMNVITGETGSGKSLILDSIQRTFDKRSGVKDLLSHGAQRGRVELVFDLGRMQNRLQIEALLTAAGVDLLPDDTELVVSREISPSSSRCRVNGCQVPLDLMEKLGLLMLEIYGQHDLHALFSSARQRELLDNLGGEPLLSVRQEVRRAYRELQQLRIEIEALKLQQQDRDRRLDFLTYQIQEIVQAELLDPKEDEHLQQERDRLAHVESLSQAAQKAAYLVTGEDYPDAASISRLLNQVQKQLSSGTGIDPQFSDWYERISCIHEELQTLAHEFHRYTEALDTRPERMHEIIERLDTLEKLKRKYGGTLENVLKTAAELEAELDTLEQADTHLSSLEAQLERMESHFQQLCQTLTDLRQQVAASLEDEIASELRELMLPAAQFQIAIQPVPPSEFGQEQVTFLFSANPGEPLKPLAQVASGGELSRLMLALKIRTAHADGVSTLILDEIDTGMSGITVRAVSEKLQALASQYQILVITHQPILAAKGSWHLHVQKQLHPNAVEVTVTPLVYREQRKLVLSRLASGFTEDDEATAQFVEQLLS